ncbi:MAG: DUF4340 domain-containing protein [Candidatus Hydrogenedentes bacterium]|nr:DUF4340 domain-containing protein [Candidatus Hydrogenedentota bacterium]
MSFKKLLPFLAVLVVLLLLVLMKRGLQRTPSLETQANLQPLVAADLGAADIAKLELYAGAAPDEKVVLEKAGDAWVARSHFGAPVNADTIQGYLDKIENLQGEFRATAQGDAQLASYDLKEDQAFRVVAYAAGKNEPAADLLFGKAPSHSSVFVRKAGDTTVYVESNNLRREAGLFGEDLTEAPKADKWLDKTALSVEKDTLAKVSITTPDKSLVFEKRVTEVPQPEPAEGEEAPEAPAAPQVEEEWILTAGGAEKTYKDNALQGVFNRLASLTASNIVDPSKKAEWGLETPGFTLAAAPAEGDEIVIEGGRPDLAGVGYIRVASNERDVVYELSAYNFDQLFPKGSSLMDLPKWDVPQEEITGITIDQPEGRIVLAKQGEKWSVVEPASSLKVQQPAIDGLVSAVSAWTPGDYADGAAETGAFNRSVQVTAGGSVRSFSIADDARGSEGVYARMDSDSEIYVMKTADKSKVFLKPRDVFQLALFDLTAGDVTRLDARAEGQAVSLRQGEAGAWTIEMDGATFESPGDEAANLLSVLLDLEAADVNFGGAPSGVTEAGAFTITTRNGASRLLVYGEENEGVHPVSVSGMQNTFTVAAADLDRLLTALNAVKDARGEAAPAAAPAAEAPATEAPVTEAPATEAPATEVPAAEAPAVEEPAAEAPVTEAPAAEVPAAETPVTEAPAAEAPATQEPAAEAPAAEAPAVEAPAVEAPAAEAPAAEAPAAEAPAAEAPAVEEPAADASTPETPAE